MDTPPTGRPELLRRRNALWLSLRLAEEGSEAFEVALSALSALIGWDRDRILAGLGLPAPEAPRDREDRVLPED